MPTSVSRQDAWTLLAEWVSSPSLRRHALAVEGAMRAYAPRFDGDVELWGATGLLHDLDYERYPNLQHGPPRMRSRRPDPPNYPLGLVRPGSSNAVFLGGRRRRPRGGAWSRVVGRS